MNLQLRVPFMLFHRDVRPTNLRGTDGTPPPAPTQASAKPAPTAVAAKKAPAAKPAAGKVAQAAPVKMRFEYPSQPTFFIFQYFYLFIVVLLYLNYFLFLFLTFLDMRMGMFMMDTGLMASNTVLA